MMNPLERLPPEIVLRIIDFASVSTITSLLRLNTAWHTFIDITHQDAIYSSLSKTWRPCNSRDLSFLDRSQSFAKYFESTASWKDLCKRQTLVKRACEDKEPTTRESIIQVGNDAVWRFRPDFERRFVLSTSQQGGLNVTDMDTGVLLWRLPNDRVRPFAHLEYQHGMMVFDREANALEVWRTGIEGLPRGTFRQVAMLPHQYQTRGFQLSYDTLCVVSTEGKGFVYDMSYAPPELKIIIDIEEGAVGHLDQSSDAVMVSMGKRGYYFYDKDTGARLGCFEPNDTANIYHIRHPPSELNNIISTGNAFDSLPSVEVFPPRRPSKDRLTPIKVGGGPLHPISNEGYVNREDDEWGAAVFCGSLLAGISRGGRLMVCTDWRACLQDPKQFDRLSYMIECESDGSSFDLGGWLSFRNNRVLFEIQDQVYLVALELAGFPDQKPSYAFTTSSSTQLAVPVSFMAIYDDCIMSTYTTLGWRRRTAEGAVEHAEQTNRFRIFPTKTIRVLSFAPSLEAGDQEDITRTASIPSAVDDETHANILEIMDMLSADEDEDEDDNFAGEDADGVW